MGFLWYFITAWDRGMISEVVGCVVGWWWWWWFQKRCNSMGDGINVTFLAFCCNNGGLFWIRRRTLSKAILECWWLECLAHRENHFYDFLIWVLWTVAHWNYSGGTVFQNVFHCIDHHSKQWTFYIKLLCTYLGSNMDLIITSFEYAIWILPYKIFWEVFCDAVTVNHIANISIRVLINTLSDSHAVGTWSPTWAPMCIHVPLVFPQKIQNRIQNVYLDTKGSASEHQRRIEFYEKDGRIRACQ